MKQVKRSLKTAIWFAIGITLGASVIPGLMFSEQPTEMSLWTQSLLYFGVAFVFAFITFCVIDWMKSRQGK